MCTRLGRPIFTPCRLRIVPGLLRRHDAVAHEVAAEGAACGAGRGVFEDAEPRREHPAVDGRSVRAGLAREDEHRVVVHAGRLRRAVEGVEIGRRRVDVGPRRERDEHERHAAGHLLHGQVGGPDGSASTPTARAAASTSVTTGPKTGRRCVIHAKTGRSPSHSMSTGVGPTLRPKTHRCPARRESRRRAPAQTWIPPWGGPPSASRARA